MLPALTFVLIPGAWHGGWAWRPVAQRLRAHGHRALTLTMPGLNDGDDATGLTLQDAVDHVVDQVRSRTDGPVVLVAHSWGGVPAAGAAHLLGDRVARLVFCSAYVPTTGVALNDENPPESAAYVRAAAAASAEGSVSVPFEAFAAALMQDQPEPVQRLVFNLLTPMPGRYLLDVLAGPGAEDLAVPSAYVLADDDHGLALPGEQLAARLGVQPIMVPGGHEALLTHPDDVARALLVA